MKSSDQNAWLRDRYSELTEVGIALNNHYTVENLLEVVNSRGLHGVVGLLRALGGAYGRLPHFHLSNNIWLFDAECVEDPQAYADIAIRIDAITSPTLSLSSILSNLDFNANSAWLEFECQQVHYRWDLALEDDWVDPKVFDKFCHLLESLNPTKALASCELDLSTLFVYTDLRTIDRIRSITGLTWNWLENPPLQE
jgi:hypothetical protein